MDVAETGSCLAGLGDHKYGLRTLEVLFKDLELGLSSGHAKLQQRTPVITLQPQKKRHSSRMVDSQ